MSGLMKLAVFKNIELGSLHGWETVGTDNYEQVDRYIRVSEYVDVEFPPLKGEEVVQKQLTALDKAEGELRGRFQAALNQIEQQRQELRALTYRPE